MADVSNREGNLLVVDDSPTNLQVLERMLGDQGYTVRPVPNGKLALTACRKLPPDLVLLDIDMPGMDGFEVCEALKKDEALREIPVIFLSGHAGAIDKVKAFAVGGVDYITKPFHIEELTARVRTHLQNRALHRDLEATNRNLASIVASQVREISALQMATIFAMANLAECRDKDTGDHLSRVRANCRLLARRLAERGGPGSRQIDEDFVEIIFQTSPLHDIGKVGIPDGILLKPGRLTAEEFEIIKTHTVIGADVLESVRRQFEQQRYPFLEMGIVIARNHHEWWNGTGYPDGLAGEDIPLAARIMAVVDVYDALTSKRVYKEAVSHDVACEQILGEKGTHFDPAVAEVFWACREECRFSGNV